MQVPFFRPSITDAEVKSVVKTLRSGWLTSGPRCRAFEVAFGCAVGARHAVALSSCTAALHLGLEASGVKPGDMVLVPTFTFAATAEVVRHVGAVPVFVDVEPLTLCMDPRAATATLAEIRAGRPTAGLKPPYGPVRAILPVHYGGQVADVVSFRRLSEEHGLSCIEDCAHAFPSQWRESEGSKWRAAGAGADVACFSFYANKTLTTGEGGMAVTDDPTIAERMRMMSLHGLSQDAWGRFESGGSWDYEVVEAGFKYNLTDLAAALGLVQLERADSMWEQRCRLAARYADALADIDGLELSQEDPNRRSSWHLYAIRLRLDRLGVTRDEVVKKLRERGIGTSVHWRPLHMQTYYQKRWGYRPETFPVAAREFPRLISLPLFPDMTDEEQDYVVCELRSVLSSSAKPSG